MNETLKRLREQHGYSQAKIADYLGISRQMYIRYENGTTEPSVAVVKSLAELYKVTVSEIIESSSNPNVEYKIKPDKGLVIMDSGTNAASSEITSLYLRNIFALMQKLNTDELVLLIEKAAKKIKEKNHHQEFKPLTKEEKLKLFYKFKGYIKDRKIENCREEYLNYLDERYNK